MASSAFPGDAGTRALAHLYHFDDALQGLEAAIRHRAPKPGPGPPPADNALHHIPHGGSTLKRCRYIAVGAGVGGRGSWFLLTALEEGFVLPSRGFNRGSRRRHAL
jgi:hypothetical protein